MVAGDEFGAGELALQGEPLRDRERAARALEMQPAAVEQQQILEAGTVQRPVAHRPDVDMDKARARVPADPRAASLALCSLHGASFEPSEMSSAPAVDALAVLGHAEHRSRSIALVSAVR
jgi:hypothetical protein